VPKLHLKQGNMLGIQGASGAGKNTLLYALAGLIARPQGKILWGQTN
jgi:ABC-type sulfate/molybdate transport systems ATPase subunit